MCGIAGVLNKEPSQARVLVSQLNRAQAHRGPDDIALVRAGSFTLGNTRLAIQDPTPAGNQPFTSFDGRIICVFNGEIYNARELSRRYDISPSSRCDGAVIPELWRLQGASCLRLLRGMYAIAVVDTSTDTLTLARDHFGIKPLYVRSLDGGGIAFASEPRALAAIEPRPRILPAAIASFLHLGALDASESPFEGISALPPNTTLTVKQNGHTVPSSIERDDLSTPDAHSDFRSNLAASFQQSVGLHLNADVPTALLLSSGFDSAAIAAAARALDQELHCVTISVPGNADEGPGARQTADRYGHTHVAVRADVSDDQVYGFFNAMQRPTIDGLNSFLVSKAISREGYKVAVSGLGGDEILGGYSHFAMLRLLPGLRILNRRIPGVMHAAARFAPLADSSRARKASRLIRGTASTPWQLGLLQRELFDPVQVKELTEEDAPIPQERRRLIEEEEQSAFAALVDAEVQHYLQRTLLPDADAFSMTHSLELRVPFVDWPFAMVARRALRRRRAIDKGDLASGLSDPYLAQLSNAKKQGFSLPMSAWMNQGGVLEPVIKQASRRDAPLWDFVDMKRGLEILTPPFARWSEPWALVALNAWLGSLEQKE